MWPTISQMIADFEQGKLSRRELIAGLGATVTALAGIHADASAEPTDTATTFTALELNHVALNVTDVPRSRDWYQKHLGLTVRRQSPHNCFMNCGPHFLALFQNPQPGLNHYCYTIKDYDPANAVTTLQRANLNPRRTENRVYFNDPDGITVQVSAKN